LFRLCGKRPIEIQLRYRTLGFIYTCINSDNKTVRSVTRHKLSATDWSSTLAKSYAHCCKFFGIPAMILELDRNFEFSSLQTVGFWSRFVIDAANKIDLLFELLMLRNGIWILSLSSQDVIDKHDIKTCIYFAFTD
jgi:hypothetical protein